jgi:hypothetical protein
MPEAIACGGSVAELTNALNILGTIKEMKQT